MVQEADSRLPIFDVKTLTEQVDDSLVQERLVASLSTLFGMLALLLTCVGLYGLVAYSVARRTHEIGIRMALGAERVNVLKLVVGEGLDLTLVGVGLGIAGALVLTRFLSSLLYGVNPADPLTFVVVPLILVVVAVTASYIPARRATRVDPMVALRYE
jgi:ABC-type antimicrobial peptide transport system permease subunit